MIVTHSTNPAHAINLRHHPVIHIPAMPPRSPGLHLSSIIRGIALRTGELDDDNNDIDYLIRTTPATATGSCASLVRAAVGFAWEHYQAPRIPGLIHQPGEMEVDGVYMNPDGVLVDNAARVISHEFKATWSSTRKQIENHPMWLWSFMGYLKGWSCLFGELCATTVLHPLYVNGNYKGSGPIYAPLEIEFTEQEINMNWEMIMAYRHLGQPEGEQ